MVSDFLDNGTLKAHSSYACLKLRRNKKIQLLLLRQGVEFEIRRNMCFYFLFLGNLANYNLFFFVYGFYFSIPEPSTFSHTSVPIRVNFDCTPKLQNKQHNWMFRLRKPRKKEKPPRYYRKLITTAILKIPYTNAKIYIQRGGKRL